MGPNQREFTIYSALFTHQSPVFEKLVNGNFSESTEKCVQWKSVDEDTFICFWQYTHTGRYTAASPVIGLKLESEATCEPPPPSPPSPAFALFASAAAKKDETPPKKPTKREIQWNEFKNQRDSAYFGAFRSTDGLFGPGYRSNHAHEDYTNNFLLHARIYVFAECYGIAGLMNLSLNELHGTLVRFTLYKERINDVVTLIRYCYENLVPEPLREVVALYTACKLEKLWLSEEFHALVEAYGELSKTLFGLIVNVL